MLNRQRVLNNLGFMENAEGIVAVILLLFSPIWRLKFNEVEFSLYIQKVKMMTKKSKRYERIAR